MLHDERPIRLDELAEAIKRLYKAMDRLDSKLIHYEGGRRESVFIMSPVLYNRRAISFAYDLTNQYAQHELEKEVKLVLYNLPAESIIDSLDAFEKIVDEFYQKGEKHDYSDRLYMEITFLASLGANLSHLTSLSLGLCVRYELDLLQGLEPEKGIIEVNRRIKELERDQNFYSKEHAITLYEYRTQKLRGLNYLKEDLEAELKITDTASIPPNSTLEIKTMETKMLEDISHSGNVIIHKDLSKEVLSTLKRLASKGFIEKVGFEYKMLPEGYEQLKRLQNEESKGKSETVSGSKGHMVDWGEVRELIASNKWDKAIARIKSTIESKSEEFDLIVSIESQITAYKTSVIKGVMSIEEDSRSRSKITSALLEVIKLLEV